MNLLLDTHILLWVLAKPKRLPDKALQAIHQADEVFFSPVNLWEIGIKASIWSDYNIKHPDDIYAACLKANLQEMKINSADMISHRAKLGNGVTQTALED
jgi:PIN domain nuclease of toxin-antitoxin system